jgi:hypothetical protein
MCPQHLYLGSSTPITMYPMYVCIVLRHLIIKEILSILTRNEILEVQIAGGDGGGVGHGHLVAGLAIKNPPKKTHPKKPQKTH